MSNESLNANEGLAWRGTPFEEVIGHILTSQQHLETAAAEHQRIIDERNEAMARAAEPFEEPINQTEQQIKSAENELGVHTLSERLRGLDLDPMIKTAFAVDLRSRGTSVEKFANSLKASITNSDPHIGREADGIVQRLRDFEAFYNELRQSDGPLTVAAIHMGWVMDRDIEAEEKGQQPIESYTKKCSIHIGYTDRDAIEVKMEDIANEGELLEAWQPCAIELDLSNTHHIYSKEFWGSFTTENKPTQQGSTLPLVGGETGCDLSQDLDFSMVRHSPRFGSRRSEPKTFLVWGDKVSEAVDILRNDADIPGSTKVELSRITMPPQN